MPTNDLPYRVRDLEATVKRLDNTATRHQGILDEHGKRITEGRANERHLVKAVEEVKEEIKSFKNYALATMILFIVSLIGALWALIQGGGMIPPM